MIFFSRMYDSKWCRIGTSFKLKQFRGCFERTLESDMFYNIANKYHLMEQEMIYKEMENKYLHFEDELDYIYPNYENKDVVAYILKVNLENNKLNITKLANEVLPCIKGKYCVNCGEIFVPNSNRQCRCENCREIYTRQKSKERKRKQRLKVDVTL